MENKKKEYPLPNPQKESEWFKCLIISFKTLKGFEFDDRGWDSGNFARCARSAKVLLEICGSLRSADACMVELGTHFDNKALEWTLETICRYASEWVQKKRGGNAARNTSRRRFFEAMSKRGSGQKVEDSLVKASPREVLDSIRNLQAPENATNGKSDH